MAPLYNTRETFSNTALYTTTPQVSTSKDDPHPSCSICSEFCTLNFIGSTHHALQMPSCSHIFGASCIETWFDTASTCPLCRKDFFPMKPEEISTEIQELPDLFLQMFALLDEVKKRYPQGRRAVTGMENMVADLGEKVVKDTEGRKRRKREREEAGREAERLQGLRQREIEDLVRESEERARQQRLQGIEGRLVIGQAPPLRYQSSVVSLTESTVLDLMILGHDTVVYVTPALLSTRRDIAAFLAHDFNPDLAALGGSTRLIPGTLAHTRLQNSERLAARAESFGLLEAAGDVRRRRATVLNAIRLLQAREPTRSEEDFEQLRIERLQREAVLREGDEREGMNMEPQRAVSLAESEENVPPVLNVSRHSEHMPQRRRGWNWWKRN